MWKSREILRNGNPIWRSYLIISRKVEQTADGTQNTNKMKREVLNAFKKLHRTRQFVFQSDQRALFEGRKQINEHFRKNKEVKDENEIKKMLQLALDVEKELRTTVIQAVEKKKGVFGNARLSAFLELRITDDTTRLDNVSFDPNAIPKPRRRSLKNEQIECCGGKQSGCEEDKR